MRIKMKKFGRLLNSRPAGREAAFRVFHIVNGSPQGEEVILDFSGVEILTPSFGDEFLSALRKRYGKKREIRIENKETETVKRTLDLVQRGEKSEQKESS